MPLHRLQPPVGTKLVTSLLHTSKATSQDRSIFDKLHVHILCEYDNHTHTEGHTYIYIYITSSISIFPCVCVCVRVHQCLCVPVCRYASMQVSIMYKPTYIHMHIHMYTHTCVRAYVDTHICRSVLRQAETRPRS